MEEARTGRSTGSGSPEEVNFKSSRALREGGRTERVGGAAGATSLERLESIVRSEDPLERARAWLAYIDRLGSNDFEAAVSRFRELGMTEDRLGEYAQLLSAWAKVDPLAALAYAKKNTRSPFATITILSAWAGTDPDGALRWAQAEHDGQGANPYLAGIIKGIASTNPQLAYQLLTGMPKSVERGEALDAILPHIVAQGADATRAWIASITDDSLRNGAIMRSAEALAAVDPAGTAAWLLANPGEATRRRMDDVYRVWARNNPDQAIQSFAAMPAGPDRSNALRGIVYATAVKDPQAAVSMLDRYPDDVSDRAVTGVVWHSFGSDPALAMNQIARITDEEQRNQTYESLIRRWLERDPQAAKLWMQNGQLPQSIRDRVGN